MEIGHGKEEEGEETLFSAEEEDKVEEKMEFMGKLELGPVAEEAPVEEAAAEEEEDGPLEDWTRKELAEECKTLGLSDLGVKAVLIARIKEARAAIVGRPTRCSLLFLFGFLF